MNVEVPAWVQHSNQVQNGVQVKGGTNWDLSRSAVETPIGPAVDPVASKASNQCACEMNSGAAAYKAGDNVPNMEPVVTVRFGSNSAVLSSDASALLHMLPKKASVVVAAHADLAEVGAKALSEKRMKAVSDALRKNGYRVQLAKSFGNTRYVTPSPQYPELNRRVDVWAAP